MNKQDSGREETKRKRENQATKKKHERNGSYQNL